MTAGAWLRGSATHCSYLPFGLVMCRVYQARARFLNPKANNNKGTPTVIAVPLGISSRIEPLLGQDEFANASVHEPASRTSNARLHDFYAFVSRNFHTP